MEKVIFGNHASVIVPLADRQKIREFYGNVLGGKITRVDPERDFMRLGDNFYIGFLYGDVPDESAFLRTARSIWLEVKSDDVKAMQKKIVDSGLAGYNQCRFPRGHGPVGDLKVGVHSPRDEPDGDGCREV